MTMRSAASSSAPASTYTWQLPVPVSMTGTVEWETTALIRPAPPLGMSTSMPPRATIMALAPALPHGSTVWTRSAGSPTDSRALRMAPTSAALDASAALPPRRTTALPALRARTAASTVTLGRAS